MGFTRPFSRKVVHVFYQLFDSKMENGDQLWTVPKLEQYLLRRNASTNGRKTDLIERYIHFILYYTENPRIRFMFVTFQYYCRICWMSKLPRLKIKRHKIMMTGQFECAFVTGFRDKTRIISRIWFYKGR
jgi:hypothetical protein